MATRPGLDALARALDDNIAAIPGAKLAFLRAGTVTPLAVYDSATLDNSLGAEIVADAAGSFAQFWFDPGESYDAILKAANDDQIKVFEDISLVDGVGATIEVANIAALRALTANQAGAVVMQSRATEGDAGGGIFVWRSGNRSADVTADPQGAIWVAPSSAASGASGAWMRLWDGLSSNGGLDPRWFGAKWDGVTDDTVFNQACFTYQRLYGPCRIILPAAESVFSTAMRVGSGAHIVGTRGATKFITDTATFVGLNYGNNSTNTCYCLTNYNYGAATITDENITVDDVGVDWGDLYNITGDGITTFGGGLCAFTFRMCQNVALHRIFGMAGNNTVAFLACKDTYARDSRGFNNINCWFDAWDGCENVWFHDCVGRNVGVDISQGFQFTGTGSNGENRVTKDSGASNCRGYGCRNSVSNTASCFISNANDADSESYNVRFLNCYGEDCDLGFVSSGAGGKCTVTNLCLKDVDQCPVLIQAANGDAPVNGTIDGLTLEDCNHTVASVALLAIAGSGWDISRVKIINSGAAAYTLVAWFATATADNYVELVDGDAGSTGNYFRNDGDGNTNRFEYYDNTNEVEVKAYGLHAAIPGLLYGLTTATNAADPTNDFDIGAGMCADSTNKVLIRIAAAMTKRLEVAWSAGAGGGLLDAGAIDDASPIVSYHLHTMHADLNGVGDCIASLSHDEAMTCTMTIASPAVVTMTGHGLVQHSPIKFGTTGALPTGVTPGTQYYVISAGITADTFQFSATRGGAAVNTSGTQSGVHTCYPGPVLPAGYTHFRRIASIVRLSGVNYPFSQDGDNFWWTTPVLAISSNNPGASAVTQACRVPAGIPVTALISANVQDNTAVGDTFMLISSLDQVDLTPTAELCNIVAKDAGTFSAGSGYAQVKTNRSRQFRYRLSQSSTDHFVYGTIFGYIDRRRRF